MAMRDPTAVLEYLEILTRLVEIHIYSTKSHTYSTSTYYEAKNSSQFFWLAEWYVRSANMVDSSFRYPDETSTEKNNPSGRTHEVRMGQLRQLF